MDALPANRSWQPSHSHGTYQNEAITSCSRLLLLMDTWLPKTCWATIRRERIQKVTSSWFFLSTLTYTRYSAPMPLKAYSAYTLLTGLPKGKSLNQHTSMESPVWLASVAVLCGYHYFGGGGDINTTRSIVLVWQWTFSLSRLDWSGYVCIFGIDIRDGSYWRSTGWNGATVLSILWTSNGALKILSHTSFSALHRQLQEWSWQDGWEPWQTMDNMKLFLKF